MNSPGHIVIFHPAAIGDSMLATPVATTLRKNFPDTKITSWSHESLESILLDFCPAIDKFQAYNKKASLISLIRTLRALKPDLFVDLSNSTRGKIMGFCSGAKALTYRKQKNDNDSTLHAVDNFIATIQEICVDRPDNYFPTLHLDEARIDGLKKYALAYGTRTYIGIVPGVGNLRPHRGWPLKNWLKLINHFAPMTNIECILIGGPEEKEIGEKLKAEAPGAVVDLCGKISLEDTAAVLKICSLVISCDTGPAHIARAVGTQVVGLYGPTLVARSGPYGNEHLCLSSTANCSCLTAKVCTFKQSRSAGKCMELIEARDVIDKVESILELEGVL